MASQCTWAERIVVIVLFLVLRYGVSLETLKENEKEVEDLLPVARGCLELDVSGVRQIYRSKSEERCNHRESTTVWGR